MARILIAEDEKPVREVVRRALELHGHETVPVEDGSLALEALSKDTFDMLLTDIVMPNVDGIALALKASSDHPKMPILLMSGYAAERQRAHNLDALFHTVLAKPFTIDQLCDAVSATLAGEAYKPARSDL